MKLEDIDLAKMSREIDYFMSKASDMNEAMRPLLERQEKLLEDYRQAISMGDLSENAAYTDAIDDLQKIGVEMHIVRERVLRLKGALSYTYTPDNKEDSCIRALCTFVLIPVKNGIDMTDACMVFKVVPNVSMTDNHILSTASDIYSKRLIGKKTGDVISVTHRITGEEHYYKIGEIY